MSRITDKIAAWLRSEAQAAASDGHHAIDQALLDLAEDVDVDRGDIRIDAIQRRLLERGSQPAADVARRFIAFLDNLAAEEIASRCPETGFSPLGASLD